MRKILTPVAITALLLFIFFSCQREVSIEIPTIDLQKDEMVTFSFQGRVLDESGAPLESAAVTAGGTTVYTNKYGIFRIQEVQVSKLFGYVSVQKDGYFIGSRSVLADSHGSAFVQIQLLKRNITGNINSAAGGQVNIAAGVSVNFEADAFVTDAGTSYSGEVKVYAAWLNPDADNFTRVMPGDLRGVRTDNSISAMLSYGMVVVELEGAAGQKLQLASGKKSILTLPIPASLTSQTPQNIPLWYFDEGDGRWKEEGIAEKKGNTYSGEVSHFSFWNVDIPEDFVMLDMELEDQDGNTLPYTWVQITDAEGEVRNAIYTDSAGFARTWVRKNTPLQLRVSGECNQMISSRDIGPYTTNASLGKWTITIPQLTALTLTGKVVDCDNQDIKDGFVSVNVTGLSYGAKVTDGSFTRSIVKCTNEVTPVNIIAIDPAANKESGVYSYDMVSGSYDVGTLVTCNSYVSSFASYTLGEETFVRQSPSDSATITRTGKSTSIVFESVDLPQETANYISFILPDTIPRTYDKLSFTLLVKGTRYYSLDSLTVDLQRYGNIGEFIELNFESERVTSNGASGLYVPFKGYMRLVRKR